MPARMWTAVPSGDRRTGTLFRWTAPSSSSMTIRASARARGGSSRPADVVGEAGAAAEGLATAGISARPSSSSTFTSTATATASPPRSPGMRPRPRSSSPPPTSRPTWSPAPHGRLARPRARGPRASRSPPAGSAPDRRRAARPGLRLGPARVDPRRRLRPTPNFGRVDAAAVSGLRAAFGFPLTGRAGTHAVVEVFTADESAPQPEMLDTLLSIGRRTGQFHERQRAERRKRARRASGRSSTRRSTA